MEELNDEFPLDHPYAGTKLVPILGELQTFLGNGSEYFELLDTLLVNIFGHIAALESSFLPWTLQ